MYHFGSHGKLVISGTLICCHMSSSYIDYMPRPDWLERLSELEHDTLTDLGPAPAGKQAQEDGRGVGEHNDRGGQHNNRLPRGRDGQVLKSGKQCV